MKLQNKVALVTGASRGMGRAIALLFAQEGAKVVVNYLKSQEKAAHVVAEIKKAGSEAIAIKADVSDEAQVKQMVRQAVERLGKIDILVNNAGIVFDIPYMEKTVDQWNKTLGTNLIGGFLTSKYCAPYMGKGGRIINISSTNGIYSMHPESADYDASKAGVIAMTKGLAKEMASKGILVNSIAPGWINTEMNKDLPPDFIKAENERIWLKRFGEPEEIAKAALFLASDDSSYVNGTVLVVDGGYC